MARIEGFIDAPAELTGEVEPNELHIDVEIIGTGPRGFPGPQGEPGHTPEKGVDYFTPEEVAQINQGAADYSLGQMPEWARQPQKPSYALSELTSDAQHRTVTDAEKATWNDIKGVKRVRLASADAEEIYRWVTGGYAVYDLDDYYGTDSVMWCCEVFNHSDMAYEAKFVSIYRAARLITIVGTGSQLIYIDSPLERVTNKVTSMPAYPDDDEYLSAKAVKNYVTGQGYLTLGTLPVWDGGVSVVN